VAETLPDKFIKVRPRGLTRLPSEGFITIGCQRWDSDLNLPRALSRDTLVGAEYKSENCLEENYLYQPFSTQ
jgi:hypothetical protein